MLKTEEENIKKAKKFLLRFLKDRKAYKSFIVNERLYHKNSVKYKSFDDWFSKYIFTNRTIVGIIANAFPWGESYPINWPKLCHEFDEETYKTPLDCIYN